MQVLIENKTHDFDSDYNSHKPADNGWEKQNQDAFKISTIGGKKIFVKRFEKKTKFIPGYDFLFRNKNKKLPFLPMIYDICQTLENGNEVTYIFQEVINGKTLAEIIKDGEVFNFKPHLFMRNLYSAFLAIIREGFWYSDFVEKNIFVGYDGNCYLIDLDSVVPLTVLPLKESFELSQISRDYIIAVGIYWYRDALEYNYATLSSNLSGDTLNFLQLFIFIGQISYYLSTNQNINFLSRETRMNTVSYLLKKDKILTEAIFKSSFTIKENNTIHQQSLQIELLNYYIQNVLFDKNDIIKVHFN